MIDHSHPTAHTATHQVYNQVLPLFGHNLYAGDPALQGAVYINKGRWAEADLHRYGEICGRPEMIERGYAANEFKPIFESHDRIGNRIDLVRYHPSYHQLMQLALSEGLHSTPWTDAGPGANVVRAAKHYLQSQLEAGHGCPVTMTFASVPTIQLNPEIAKEWVPKILNRGYDSSNRPYFDKSSLTIGMGMTEKQGGSDVRANTTTAIPVGDGSYELIGHKWFMSAPMCDAFLILAQAPGGLSCFLVPRWRPDGSKNPLEIQRLKVKAGNVSNASSEVEIRGAFGWLLGEEGRGVNAIIKMVAITRFDCMTGSSGGQRQAVVQAVYHASRRKAFGQMLIDQPLMKNVLADLQLEVEGSVALTMRIAKAMDLEEVEHEKRLLRLGAAVGKYWICKRSPHHAYEAMECLGGNGVIENFITARLYRDAPINAIWEGSGNIQALDVLRAITKTPAVVNHWLDEMEGSLGVDTRLDKAIEKLRNELADLDRFEYRARHIVDQMAITMQAHLLVQGGNEAVSDAFIASRLESSGVRSTGSLSKGVDVETLLIRANPLMV
ncbi:acyl-CoA dehydrogenase family protein [Microbulbifer sp. 2205BS26-8]|uniref:acyl-CoA dehydrogenase family protein n=1 Tax=Microbulbifer sp. 2205BS26-8 TaxID=3064386 RepID=UPI00273E4FE5|nr:acyl-CoA dehydrogenase family protein [Microbulbifer sp. 2205BS26-8]MDP5209324.1 acyl-CoA dehydrogenase family protein [Microbulbifer sp. 2205BS26-8]